jgi:hypothetical protein
MATHASGHVRHNRFDPSLARLLPALQPPMAALDALRMHYAKNACEVHDGATYHLLLLNAQHKDAMLHWTLEPPRPPETRATLSAAAVRREPATPRAPDELDALEAAELAFVHDVVLVLAHWMWLQALP